MIEVHEIQGVIDKLERVHTQRIKAEATYEKEMDDLEELGFESIEDAEASNKKLKVKIQKKGDSLKEDFEDFITDYEALFE